MSKAINLNDFSDLAKELITFGDRDFVLHSVPKFSAWWQRLHFLTQLNVVLYRKKEKKSNQARKKWSRCNERAFFCSREPRRYEKKPLSKRLKQEIFAKQAVYYEKKEILFPKQLETYDMTPLEKLKRRMQGGRVKYPIL